MNTIHMKVVMNDKQKNYYKQISLERKLTNLPEPPKQRKLPQGIILLNHHLHDQMHDEQIPLSHDFLNQIENEINKQDNVHQGQEIHDQDIEEFLEQMMNQKDHHDLDQHLMDNHHIELHQDHSDEKYDEKYEDHHHSKEEEYENILSLINQSENQLQHVNLQNKSKIKEHHDHSSLKTKNQQKYNSISSSDIETSEEQQQSNHNSTSLFLDHLIRDNKDGQNDMMHLLNQLNKKFDQLISIVNDIKENGVNHKEQQNQKLDIHIEEINKIFENLHQDELKFQQETGLGEREFSVSEKSLIKDILCLIENLPEDVKQKIIIPQQYEQMLHDSQIIKEDKNQIGQHINDFIEFIEQFQNKQQQQVEQHHDMSPFLGNKQINYDDMIPLLEKNEKFDPHYTDQNQLTFEQLEVRREKLVRQYLKEHPNFQFDQVHDEAINKLIQPKQTFNVDHESSSEKGMIHYTTVQQPIISKYKSNANHMEVTMPKTKNVQNNLEQPHLETQEAKDKLVHDNEEKEIHHDVQVQTSNVVDDTKDKLVHDNEEKEIHHDVLVQTSNVVEQGKEQTPQIQVDEKKEKLVYDNVENDESKGLYSSQNQVVQPQEIKNASDQDISIEVQENQRNQKVVQINQDLTPSKDESIEETDIALQKALQSDSSEEHIQDEKTDKKPEDQVINALPENQINQIDSGEQVEQEIENLKVNDKVETPNIDQKGNLTPSQEEELLVQVAKANADPQELQDWENDEKQIEKEELDNKVNNKRILL